MLLLLKCLKDWWILIATQNAFPANDTHFYISDTFDKQTFFYPEQYHSNITWNEHENLSVQQLQFPQS